MSIIYVSFLRECQTRVSNELKLLLRSKDDTRFPLWVDDMLSFNCERKNVIFDGCVKKLMESDDLEAIQQMEELVFRDPRVAVGLKPTVVERLVKILDENDKESIKASVACILEFANIDECGDVIKEKATEVLVKLMSGHCTIAIPAVSTLTRLAWVFPRYAIFIVERGALEGALAVMETIHGVSNMLRNLAKFLMVVVYQVKVPYSKVQTVLTILDKMLRIRMHDLCHIVRSCYTLSYLSSGRHVLIKKEMCKNLIQYIKKPNYWVAQSALKVVADIAEWRDSYEIQILTKDCELLQCLGRSEICCKPKMFQMEACNIISNIATKGGTSIEDMFEAGLIDTLCKLLEVDDFDVKVEAACAIRAVICGLSV